MDEKQDLLNVLRQLQKKPNSNQREMADSLGFSLGKFNYCLQSLKQKGLVKINNFKKNPKKFNYLYMLTPAGVAQKSKLTILFMKKKMKEYDELEKELKSEKRKN
jgi:EPS-associated MarR family transcriptional regulator|tara:strand:- start:168 stop:482 length:315 start_codon:yes stop_codon:yes gene_type:complete